MGYLINKDYERAIQDVTLYQLINSNTALLALIEAESITEIKSYLIQKYDLTKEFTETSVYNHSLSTYQPKQRVYLNATAYSSSSTYALGDLVLYSGSVYFCKTAITVAEIWNAAKWTIINSQYSIYNAKLPYSEFNYETYYNVGDKVYYEGHVYTAIVSTFDYSHSDQLQYHKTYNIPLQNIFPDDVNYGSKYWTDEGAYSIPAGKINDTTYFTSGDNRNQQMVGSLIDMIIWKLHKRINIQIPESRDNAWKLVMAWLKNASQGNDITVELETYQPKKGNRIRFGSNVKNINSY